MRYRARLLGNQAPSYQEHRDLESPQSLVGEHWNKLVEEFTRLDLSYHSDRLAALSGLATLYQSTSDEYICGLWRSHLVRSLMWGVKTMDRDADKAFSYASRISQPQQEYDAPSWSWASVTGEIKYEGDTYELGVIESEDDIEILDVEYDRSEKNRYGPLKNCCITARGCLLPVHLDENLSFLFDASNIPEDHSLQQSPPRMGKVILDVHTGDMARHDIITQEALFCTLIQTSKTEFTPRGILLRAVEDKSLPNTFRRIGYVRPTLTIGIYSSMQSMIMEIALDTAERRVFKII